MSWSISNAMMKNYKNSRCLQGQEAESLEGICLDGKQLAQLNTTPMPDQYYWPGKTTEHSRLSRFGMTCELLTENLGEDLLTWYREGFHVKTLAQQEEGQELKEKDQGFGQKWQELLVKFDLNSHTWKTAHCLFQEDLPWSSVTLPRWGMMQNGVVYRRLNAEPIMSAIVFGFSLPTPTCHNAKEGAYPAEYTRKTPSLATHVGGKIHPHFTEWMMAWPQDWTDLKPLEMGKSLLQWRQHGGF